MAASLLFAILIGLIWGLTNPFIARGARIVAQRAPQHHTGLPALASFLAHACQPAWLLPQAANLAGSAAFAALLGSADISVVAPVANGVALAATAAGDHLLGDRLPPARGLIGLALVWAGVSLCAKA